MPVRRLIVWLVVMTAVAAFAQTGQQGDYAGQPRPGTTPVRFAPGVVSTDQKDELNAVFTPDGTEFYFAVNRGPMTWTIMRLRREGNRWTGPVAASFSGTYSDVDLSITADGVRLYFCSNRPASGTGDAKADFDIWVVEREGRDWSSPRRLAAPVNSNANEFYPTLTRDGVLYFQSMRPGGEGPDLYRAQPAGDEFAAVERLPAPVNSTGFESDPFIAPDGSFLVFSRVDPEGRTRGDLFVSRRDPGGAWGAPSKLGAAINTTGHENCPMLSPDGRYLFFTRDGDIFWVDASVLHDSREP